MTIDEDEFFENLSQLVNHYKQDADGLCTQLTKELKSESSEGGKNGRYHDVDLNAFKEAGWVIEESEIKVMTWSKISFASSYTYLCIIKIMGRIVCELSYHPIFQFQYFAERE